MNLEEYEEEIKVFLKLHKNIATILRIFSKSYAFNDEDDSDDDATNIAVSKKE